MTPALATTEASQEDALTDAGDSLSIDASTSAPGVSDDSLDQNGAVTEGADSPDDNLRLVAEHIAKEHGLSQREVDVFMLLARGYTSSRIQKELYIAAGTVNYHTRNIYAKLGVHSKQELIELFEATKAERR